MMLRTHIVITMMVVLLFLPHISGKFLFIFVALIATAIPDMDTGFSTVGRMKATRVVQFLVRHRGVFHSFTFCIIVAVILAAFIPVLALPFFLGYSLHLFADSFTVDGIKPYWPLKHRSYWRIRVGSLTETSLFIFFLLVDIFLFIFLVTNIL